MSPHVTAAGRLVFTGLFYVVFLVFIGELPSSPGAATIGLVVVWCAQAAWEIRSVSRLRRGA